MKKVEALLPPFFTEKLRKTLPDGIFGMTISEVVTGTLRMVDDEGKQRKEYEQHPRIKVEIVIADDETAILVETIANLIRSLQTSGVIYVLSVDESLRIRTEERGERSLA